MDPKKTPNPENETPPIKLISFPNGKTHHHAPPHTAATYRECLKNHAATIGGHAVDGCGEFMPSPTYTLTEPTSLKCDACGCHRNFHRREPAGDFVTRPHIIDFHRPSTSPPPPPTNYAYAPQLLLSLSTAAEQTHTVATPGTPAAIKIENPNGRKRFRTKFSHDQKEKMLIFAEKLGWKMQRCDDKMVSDFCIEIGIRQGIFKVWMHNNKNTFGKREKDTSPATASVAAAAVTGEAVHLQGSTNGSSSSS